MRKKLIVCTVLLMAFMLNACGGSATPAQTAQPAANAATDAPAAEAAPTETDPVSDVVDILWVAGQDSFDPETDYTKKLILDKLGVNIIASMVATDSNDAINLMLSSGEKYDMIKTNNRAGFDSWVKNGVIQDLTDEVNEFGPNLTNIFEKSVWDMVSYNDNIFAIPEMDTQDIEWGLAIRQDWLDALGEPIPETAEDFYRVLKRFKEEDPGNVGSDNVIPFTTENSISFNGMAQAFGISDRIDLYIEKDGKLLPSLEQPGAKECVAYFNKLYTEGLMDADYPTNGHDQVTQKLASGLAGAGIIVPWDSGTQRSVNELGQDAKLVFCPPFKDAGGNRAIASRGGLKNFAVVPTASDKAAEVVKYCNDFMDDANYVSLILGEENVHYEVKDGIYYPILPAFDELNKGRWFYPTNDGEKYTPLFSARAHKELEMGEMWDDINAKGEAYKYLDISKLMPIMPEIESTRAKLQEYAKENIIKMIIDADEFAKFDEFVAKWKADGGDEMTEAYNAWYAGR